MSKTMNKVIDKMNNDKGGSMKIIELKSENVKRLKAVTIKPDGNTVILAGNNEQGKTSVLDSIEMALRGKKSIPARPIRDGQSKAKIVIDLDELIVTRTFTQKGSSLKVENKEGLAYTSPQQVLDKLLSSVSFDPLEFSHMDSKGQMKTIQDLTGLDFTEVNERRKLLYENRTMTNRDLKKVEGAVQSYSGPDSSTKEMPSTSVIVAELEAATKSSNELVALNKKFDNAKNQDVQLRSDLAHLKETVKRAEKEIADNNTEGKELVAKINAWPSGPNLDDIRAKLATIEDDQADWREYQHHQELLVEEKAMAKKANGFTNDIEKIDSDKKKALKEANLPVDGLELREDGVYLNELPFDQASGAVKIKTSVALGIMMNPKLKVLIIRDGSLLDANSMEAIRAMAIEHDAQIWIERVGKGDIFPVIIEDGEVEEA